MRGSEQSNSRGGDGSQRIVTGFTTAAQRRMELHWALFELCDIHTV